MFQSSVVVASTYSVSSIVANNYCMLQSSSS